MLQSETLDAVRRSAAIPSMPLVATRCFEITQNPECSYDQLVELLGTDPGIAAEILRLSNSALFGVARQVTSLKQAIALLGLKRLRDLVLMRYLVQRVDEARSELLDLAYFWRRSLTTAVVAARLADTLLPRRRDEAFVSGLLADIGVVVLARALPLKYGPIAKRYRPNGGDSWMTDERMALGVTHGEVSAVVLEEWSLPSAMVDAVRYSDRPALAIPADAPGRALAPIITCAAALARSLCDAREAPQAAHECLAALEPVALGPRVLAEMLPKVGHDVENLASMLRINVIAGETLAQVAEQLAAQLAQPTA